MFKLFGNKPTPKPIPTPIPAASVQGNGEAYSAFIPPQNGSGMNYDYPGQSLGNGGRGPRPPNGGRGPGPPRPFHPQHAPPPMHSDWNCPACTFANNGMDQICSMCGLTREIPSNFHPGSESANKLEHMTLGPRSGPNNFGPPPQKHQDNFPSAPQLREPPSHNEALDKLRQNVRHNHGGPQQQQNVANVHASVVFPNGEYFEQSLSCPIDEVEARLSSLLIDRQQHQQHRPHDRHNANNNNKDNNDSVPRYDAFTGFENVPDAFKESLANAGVAGGERVPYSHTDARLPSSQPSLQQPQQDDVSKQLGFSSNRRSNNLNENSSSSSSSNRSNRQAAVGPHQRAPTEHITLNDRNTQLQQQRQQDRERGGGGGGGRLEDGGGSRVNQSSTTRLYSLENYEKSVYIDPQRHLNLPETEAKEREATDLRNVGVPVEVAAVSAKIRNIHRVAGERVKEMDHFVASVETPIVRLALPGTEASETGAAGGKRITKNDIGAYLQASFKKTGLDQSVLLTVPTGRSIGSSVPLMHAHDMAGCTIMVEGQYVNNATTRARLAPHETEYILRYASIFMWMLQQLLVNVLHFECSPKTMQLYYLTTIRADELVCSLSTTPGDQRLYFNVLVFQQSLCCGLHDNNPQCPTHIHRHKLKEVLAHWLNRIVTALYHKKDNQQAPPLPPPFGLATIEANKRGGFGDARLGVFDKAIRSKFYDLTLHLMAQLSTQEPQQQQQQQQSQAAPLSSFEEGVALMSTSAFKSLTLKTRNGGSAVSLSPQQAQRLLVKLEELFSRALAESREKEDMMAERAAEERLRMVQSIRAQTGT